MKKIYFSLMLLCAMAFTSCSMDKAPYGSLDDKTAIEKEQDLRQFRNAMYTNLRAVTSGSWLYLSDVQMDEFHGLISNGNRLGQFSNGLITITDGDVSSKWSGSYSMIATANAIMERAANMQASDAFSKTDKIAFAHYDAEAHFVRAYMYFWLADHFCQSYTQCDPTKAASGLPLTTVYKPTGNLNDYPGRSTLAETFALIEEDMQKAYDGLVAYEKSGVKNAKEEAQPLTYIHSQTVQALQARVALVKGDWANAAKYAKAVINSGKYKLTTIDDYAKLWTKDEGTEIIFRPLMTAQELGSSNGEYYVSESETKADYIPTAAVLNLFWEKFEGDVRADVFLKQYDNLQVEGNSYEAMVFNKFPGNSDLRTGSNNNLMNMSKPFRLSEMYLIVAEAEARQDHKEEANKYLNILRSNRIVDYVTENYSEQKTLLKEIKEEREREFIGEGMRMSDIRRYGEGFQREPNHDENEALNDIIVKQGRALKYTANDYRLTWPIPKAEMDANPHLAGQQNPGY